MKTRLLNKNTVIDFVEKELDIKLRNVKTRTNDLVFARSIVYYVCIEHLNMTYKDSGKLFKKNHATVIHSVKKILPQLTGMRPYSGLILKIDKIFELGGDLYAADLYFQKMEEDSVENAKNLSTMEENKVLKQRVELLERRLSCLPKNDEIYHLLESMPKRKMNDAENRIIKSLRLALNA